MGLIPWADLGGIFNGSLAGLLPGISLIVLAPRDFNFSIITIFVSCM